MNEIVVKQNIKTAIDKLFTQRKLYSESKLIFYIRFWVALMIAIFIPILASVLPEQKNYFALFSVVYLLIEVILEKIEKNKRSNAAKVQELFDTEVFCLNWNSVVAGQKPDQELISNYILKETGKDVKALNNWYPTEISKLSRNQAVIICQRANVWWDSTLRNKLVSFSFIFLVILTFLAVVLNIHKTLGTFLIVIIPLVPLYKVVINQIVSHKNSIRRLDFLKEKIDQMIESKTQASMCDADLRLIQDEIFRHRTENQPVPDFFYKIFRDKSEKIMNITAEQYIEKILYAESENRQSQ